MVAGKYAFAAPPTAMHVVELGHAIACSCEVVPDDCGIQVLPPSKVARIVPAPPTAKQVVGVGQLSPKSGGGDVIWVVQVAPASVVATMVPGNRLPVATAKHVVPLGQLMAVKLLHSRAEQPWAS